MDTTSYGCNREKVDGMSNLPPASTTTAVRFSRSGRSETTDRQLNVLYAQNDGAVAYVDEAYRDGGADPFYVMSAVIIEGDREPLREDLRDLLGNFWHTAEALRSSEGQALAVSFAKYIVGTRTATLCVLETTLSRFDDIEVCRRHCFANLANILVREHATTLVVYERRREGIEETNDFETARQLQQHFAKVGLRFHGGTPTSEPLLWIPDLVASTLRRRIALKQHEWFEPLRATTPVWHLSRASAIILPE